MNPVQSSSFGTGSSDEAFNIYNAANLSDYSGDLTKVAYSLRDASIRSSAPAVHELFSCGRELAFDVLRRTSLVT